MGRLCADRKVNGEPLVLILDSPIHNPLNAIGDVSNDPLKIDSILVIFSVTASALRCVNVSPSQT